jgi:hypothetical protein
MKSPTLTLDFSDVFSTSSSRPNLGRRLRRRLGGRSGPFGPAAARAPSGPAWPRASDMDFPDIGPCSGATFTHITCPRTHFRASQPTLPGSVASVTIRGGLRGEWHLRPFQELHPCVPMRRFFSLHLVIRTYSWVVVSQGLTGHLVVSFGGHEGAQT